MPVVKRRGLRALQIWLSRVTSSYTSVNITDMTSSFRDGLAFCAIIHHFRPDLIANPDTLDATDIVGNNQLAFKVAEDSLDVPSLLDPKDMAECEEPDKFSVVTYVSQFYHLFKDADDSRFSPVVGVLSRSSESENDSGLVHSSSSESSTPLGTPKSQPRFNQADLIAKYGEEIFAKSSPEKKNNVDKQGINSLCSDLVTKARLCQEKHT